LPFLEGQEGLHVFGFFFSLLANFVQFPTKGTLSFSKVCHDKIRQQRKNDSPREFACVTFLLANTKKKRKLTLKPTKNSYLFVLFSNSTHLVDDQV
jgi:hypothetical protein